MKKYCLKWIAVAVMSVLSQVAFPQTRELTGKIVDKDGEDMPFVNVVLLSLPDSTIMHGTVTDEQGMFSISADISIGNPVPAVCIRTSTERPEALDKACFILAGIDEKRLLQAVDTAVSMTEDGNHGIPVPDYTEELVSTKVVKIIQSYTGVVDKMVWRKF